MLMNYHEMTMDEPRNSFSRKLQFRVICVVMASCIVWALVSSGALRPVEVTEGVFPGGEFVYKFTGRDYAASQSLVSDCGKDLGVKESEQGNILYTLYLDDPLVVNGRRQRFASGYLLNDLTVTKKHENNEERKRVLMEVNSQIKELSQTEKEELSAFELWPRLKYASQELPSVKAAVVQYKYSGGFVSALVHSYKVFPTIRQWAIENGATGSPPVVATTCNMKDGMCMHYVPLENPGNVFRLGTHEYSPEEYGGAVNWDGVRKMAINVLSFGTRDGEVKQATPLKTAEETTIKKAPEPIANEKGSKGEAKEETASEKETPVDNTAPETTTSTPETPAETEAAAAEEAIAEEVHEKRKIEADSQEEVPAAEEKPESGTAAQQEPAADESAQEVMNDEVPPANENTAAEEAAHDHMHENAQQAPDRDEL